VTTLGQTEIWIKPALHMMKIMLS